MKRIFGMRRRGEVRIQEEEEDWYLASGGMCQRNSCREGIRTQDLWEGLSTLWRGSGRYTTTPLCQRILVSCSRVTVYIFL